MTFYFDGPDDEPLPDALNDDEIEVIGGGTEFLESLHEALTGFAADPPTVGAIGFVWISDEGDGVAIACRALGLNSDALALLGMLGAPQLSQYVGAMIEGYEPPE